MAAMYQVGTERLSFEDVRALIDQQFPEASPKISDTLLRKRLQRTTNLQRIGEDPSIAAARGRRALGFNSNYRRNNKK